MKKTRACAVYKGLDGWTRARPADDIDRGDWWSIYNDPLLDELERQVDIGNQNLRAYEAAYRKARATLAEARSALFPTLSISPGALPASVPDVPVQAPATLLQRRPDIAEAERTMQQQNALIGDQTAAYYPNITLSAAFGYTSAAGALFEISKQIWSLAASGSQTLFDGWKRGAAVGAARATYEQAVADYRNTVLTGFQEVEDNLAGLPILAQQADVQTLAVASARDAVRIALNEYKTGTTTYTAAVVARTTALSAEQTALQIMGSRMTSNVGLIKGLGGGWNDSLLAALDRDGNPVKVP